MSITGAPSADAPVTPSYWPWVKSSKEDLREGLRIDLFEMSRMRSACANRHSVARYIHQNR